MEYEHDIVCPQCRSRHGPAAKSCECGYLFETPEEDPAPPRHFFLAALFFGAVTIVSMVVAQKKDAIYLPIGGLLFTSVAATLGVRSWLHFVFKNRKDEKKEEA